MVVVVVAAVEGTELEDEDEEKEGEKDINVCGENKKRDRLYKIGDNGDNDSGLFSSKYNISESVKHFNASITNSNSCINSSITG